jgi:hypothetical protein
MNPSCLGSTEDSSECEAQAFVVHEICCVNHVVVLLLETCLKVPWRPHNCRLDCLGSSNAHINEFNNAIALCQMGLIFMLRIEQGNAQQGP